DRVQRAERGHRLLGDEGDVAAAHLAHAAALRRELGEGDLERLEARAVVGRPRPAVDDLAAHDAAGLLYQAQDRLHGDALAASALADDADDLALVEVERDAVDGSHDALVELEVRLEVLDRQDRRAGAAASPRVVWPRVVWPRVVWPRRRGRLSCCRGRQRHANHL